MEAPRELALFAGAGGGILGSKLLGHRIVCAVEYNPFAREILLRRQEDGALEAFPIWDNVCTFDGRPWNGAVDIITAGFPCQPFSQAGQRRGEEDSRNMWPDTLRIIREVEPASVLLENVPGLLSKAYFGDILEGLAEAGYNAEWDIVSAAETGAPHLRKRLWILCYPDSNGKSARAVDEKAPRLQGNVANTGRQLWERRETKRTATDWPPESGVDRVADGVAYRVDRLRALGNGQVPRVVSAAFHILTKEAE